MNCSKGVGCSRKGSTTEPVLVAAEEAVGRQLRLYDNETQEFVLGQLTNFLPETGQHEFTAEDGTQEWLTLDGRRYKWTLTMTTGEIPPNPTSKNFPGNTEAIGWKIKVYWNEMGRWYTGIVRDYDFQTDSHTVNFCDGDICSYRLRHEAIVWIHPGGVRPANGRKNGTCRWVNNFHQTQPEGSESCSPSTPSDLDSVRMDNDVNSRPLSGTKRASLLDLNDSLRGSDKSASSIDGQESYIMRLRPRNPSPIEPLSGQCIVNSAIGVYWSKDRTHYRALVKSYDERSGKYHLLYDDDHKDEVDLRRESFRWLGPKGKSAGYVTSMRKVMVSLRAKNIKENEQSSQTTTVKDNEVLTSPNECVGRKLFLYWEGTKQFCEAEVLAYDAKKRLHFIWYRDGELEWLELKKETFHWGKSSRTVREFPAGLGEDECIPRGKAAIGWRISVFWKEDVQFYDGRIMKYDRSTGRHEVTYDDGDTEILSLSSEKVIWKVPPKTSTPQGQQSDTERTSLTPKTCQTTNSCPPQTPSTRKISRAAAAANPKQKRQKLPFPSDYLKTSTVGSAFDSATSSTEVAKENKSETGKILSLTKTSSLESEANVVLKKEEKQSSSESFANLQVVLSTPIPPSNLPTSPVALKPSITGNSGGNAQLTTPLKKMKRLSDEMTTTEEEDLELYLVKKIPKEPLPPVDGSRIARLPLRFGGQVFHMKIKARGNQEEESEVKSEVDKMLELVMKHQSVADRIGRLPLGVDFHSTKNVMSNEGPFSSEYPSKQMSQMTTAAVRRPLDSPLGFHGLQKNTHATNMVTGNAGVNRVRGKGRRKGRPSGGGRKKNSISHDAATTSFHQFYADVAKGGPLINMEDNKGPMIYGDKKISLLPPISDHLAPSMVQTLPKGVHAMVVKNQGGKMGSHHYPGLARQPNGSPISTSINLKSANTENNKYPDCCVSNSYDLSNLGLGYSQNMLNDAAAVARPSGIGPMKTPLAPHPPSSPSDRLNFIQQQDQRRSMEDSNGNLEDSGHNVVGAFESSEKLNISKPGDILSKSSTINMTMG